MEQESYKLVGLSVDGFRKLKAVEMKFSENGLIPIIGQNRQGKTTILESIAVLIEGKKHLKDGSINPDKERATFVGQIGDFEIYREYSETKAPVLRVTGKSGKVLQGEVQNFLNSFTNLLTISPFPFIQKTPLEKLRFLMKLYDIDFTTQDQELLTLENDRLFTGRKIKEFGVLIEPEQVDAVDLTDLMAQRKAITDRNAQRRETWETEKAGKKKEIDLYNEVMRSRSSLISRLTSTCEAISDRAGVLDNTDPVNDLHKTDIRAQTEILHEIVAAMKGAISRLPQVQAEKVLDLFAVPEPVYEPLTEIDEQIQQANATNVKASIYTTYLTRLAEKRELEETYLSLDQQIEAVKQEKLRILASIDTKVEGLTIGLEKIFYFGVDTDNMSDAENMTLSLKLCAAMQPALRAVLIDRGESIDQYTRVALDQWAKENDIQLIMSIVDEIPEVHEEGCFYIEEGRLI